MLEVMDADFANPSSEGHSAGWRARRRVEDAREMIATAVGCDADELIFTSGATEADNLGVLGAALGAPEGRRRIIVGSTEHKAVLEAAFSAEKFGFSVELLPVDKNGLIDPAELRSRLDQSVAVVSIMLVNNEIGTIQPLKKLIDLCSPSGAFFHTDATQAPIAMDIDLQELGVDAASFSSHKIYGPKGIGALYVSSVAPWKPKPLMFGGGQEQGLRPGTVPTHLCAGFAEAFSILDEIGVAERKRVAQLRDHLAGLLQQKVPEFTRTVVHKQLHPGCLHVRFRGIEADDLLPRLQPELCASTGSACTSGNIKTSHVLRALRLTDKEAREGMRFSLGRQSTKADIELAVEIIEHRIRECALDR